MKDTGGEEYYYKFDKQEPKIAKSQWTSQFDNLKSDFKCYNENIEKALEAMPANEDTARLLNKYYEYRKLISNNIGYLSHHGPKKSYYKEGDACVKNLQLTKDLLKDFETLSKEVEKNKLPDGQKLLSKEKIKDKVSRKIIARLDKLSEPVEKKLQEKEIQFNKAQKDLTEKRNNILQTEILVRAKKTYLNQVKNNLDQKSYQLNQAAIQLKYAKGQLSDKTQSGKNQGKQRIQMFNIMKREYEIKSAQMRYEQTQQAYGQAHQAYEQTQQAYGQAHQAYEQTQQAYGQAHQAYEQTQQVYGQAHQAYEQTQQAYGQAQNTLRRVKIEYMQAKKEFDLLKSAQSISKNIEKCMRSRFTSLSAEGKEERKLRKMFVKQGTAWLQEFVNRLDNKDKK